MSSDNENVKPNVSSVNAVTVKLPPFLAEQPDVWFAQAEAQFALCNITVSLT